MMSVGEFLRYITGVITSGKVHFPAELDSLKVSVDFVHIAQVCTIDR